MAVPIVPTETDDVPRISCAFRPNATRGAQVDAHVRRHTARSIAHICDAICLQRADYRAPLERLVAALDSHPVRADLFALYSDLAVSIFEDDGERFHSTLEAIAAFDPKPAKDIRCVTLAAADLGAGMSERFLRHIDEDPDAPLNIAPVASDELEAARRTFGAALRLIDAADPELGGEIRSLVRDVVFVGSESRHGTYMLHGASTFYLWGALILNARVHPDPISMADGITHEAAHSLLHGLTLGAPLVDNDPAERFPSPVREDPRPMDGIVHAAYVLARMHYCMDRLLASGQLGAAEQVRAQVAKERSAARYAEGLEVVSAHARFTPIGSRIFESARDYMREAGAG
jgi:HEXXH motif-containing protein